MNPPIRQLTLTAALVLSVLGCSAAVADEWLVYVGGGIEIIDGAWSERRGEVLFTQLGGGLVSVPYEDVDLPTSTFVTWQLNGRRQLPPLATLPAPSAGGEAAATSPCELVTVLALRGGETLEVERGDERETIHAACLDAPETDHLFTELGWFGRTTLDAVRQQLVRGIEICIHEQSPPRRDGEGHRVLYWTLPGGEDYAQEVIASGLGLLRTEGCERALSYRELEQKAIRQQRGLWGPMGEAPAQSAANQVISVAGVGSTAPPRRFGGG